MSEGKIKIVVGDQLALGTYANFASIVHNFAEFIIDFGRIVPGREDVQIVSRVVMTPVHAKQLLRALGENVAIYRAQLRRDSARAGGDARHSHDVLQVSWLWPPYPCSTSKEAHRAVCACAQRRCRRWTPRRGPRGARVPG